MAGERLHCKSVGNMNATSVLYSFIALFLPQPEGASQKVDFSCNPELVAYIPHVKLRRYPFPFLAANVDALDDVRSTIVETVWI